MRVVLLGTGGSAGVPMIGGADGRGDWGACDPAEPRNRRSRASIWIEGAPGPQPRGGLLVDTSPDLRTQLLACGVRHVAAVLYTHAHADHIVGLDDIRILNRIADRPLEAFGTEATLTEIEERFGYAFRPWQPPGFFRPVLIPRVVAPGQTIAAAGHGVMVFEQDHGLTRTLGLRVGGFGYSTDAVDLDDAAFAALEGVDTWVVGCFQRTPHRTHAWPERVLDWVDRLRPRRTVLTHMGNDMDWRWMTRRFPAHVEPGYDGMIVEVAGEG